MDHKLFILLVLVFLGLHTVCAQEDQGEILHVGDTLLDQVDVDVIIEKSKLDPQRSALLSAIVPGLGQAYNQQYWKVPIVVSGIITFGHFISYNNKLYHAFRNAVILETDGDDSTVNPYQSVISSEASLITNRDNFRRSRDYLIILGTAFYLLQIVDAHVSAHLNEFEVNEDLAIGIEPSIQSSPLFSQAVGASIVIRF